MRTPGISPPTEYASAPPKLRPRGSLPCEDALLLKHKQGKRVLRNKAACATGAMIIK